MLNNQHGSSAVMAIVVVFFLGIMAAGLAPMLNTEVLLNTRSRDLIRAQYAAEAGAKRAIVEFLKVNNNEVPDWAWLRSNRALINDVIAENYNVMIFVSNDTTRTPVVPVFTSNNTYTIQSTGRVGNTTKTIAVEVAVTGGGGSNVFSNYTTFADGNIQISGGTIIGDVGSNSNIALNSSSRLITGRAVSPSSNLSGWNTNSVSGGHRAEQAGTLDVAGIMHPMPTYPEPTGTNLSGMPLTGNVTLSNNAFFLNNLATGTTYTFTNPQTVLYIQGDLKLSKNSNTHAAIIGNDVTIYVTGNFQMDNNSFIQAATLRIFAGGTIKLTNNAMITANDLTMQTNSTSSNSIDFGSNSSINRNSTTAINRIYSNGGVQFTNQFQMNGQAGLVVAMGAFNLNSNIVVPETIFVSNSGESNVSSGRIAGIYTNGSLNINSSPRIDFGTKKDIITDTLGLSGGSATATIQAGSWRSI